jgi:hypothetical protein
VFSRPTDVRWVKVGCVITATRMNPTKAARSAGDTAAAFQDTSTYSGSMGMTRTPRKRRSADPSVMAGTKPVLLDNSATQL